MSWTLQSSCPWTGQSWTSRPWTLSHPITSTVVEYVTLVNVAKDAAGRMFEFRHHICVRVAT